VLPRPPERKEVAPPPPPSSHPIVATEARRRLAAILGPDAEQRPGQADYAAAAAEAFAPRATRGDPRVVLAEAGTGTGKTLGYIAPASLWAERNKGPVWISTFTRHLQRQVEAELARLHPDPAQRRRRVVVRKGRENYLCLLNFEDAVNAASVAAPASAIPLGLVARWALASADGDILGGDLPGWFSELFGSSLTAGLADRRSECIHAACPHWRRCFVEHTIRRARTAELVVANHALVMAQAAWGGIDDATVPSRYVFDEGHHVFDAADGAFSAECSGVEAAELRRWLLGAEGGRSRARGLARRGELRCCRWDPRVRGIGRACRRLEPDAHRAGRAACPSRRNQHCVRACGSRAQLVSGQSAVGPNSVRPCTSAVEGTCDACLDSKTVQRLERGEFFALCVFPRPDCGDRVGELFGVEKARVAGTDRGHQLPRGDVLSGQGRRVRPEDFRQAVRAENGK